MALAVVVLSASLLSRAEAVVFLGAEHGDQMDVRLALSSTGNSEVFRPPKERLHEFEGSFLQFMQHHKRVYTQGSQEYQTRLALFREHLAAVNAQNRRARRSWTAGVNALADRTAQELATLRGYRDVGRRQSSKPSSLGFVGETHEDVNRTTVPQNFTWHGVLHAMAEVRDQGMCGSCWAVSSATVLQAHSELYQQERSFSPQQILNCVPNEMKCGGTGGCQGATAELAMAYAQTASLGTNDQVAYLGNSQPYPEACPMEQRLPQGLESNTGFSEVEQGRDRGGALFGMVGYKTLPSNRYAPLVLALYHQGPVVVSIAASGAWNLYETGVMEGCEKNAVINHAVVLVGYGKDAELGYWHIQNSWGAYWGEQGFLRMQRHENEEEYCGVDNKPEEGTGCENGTSQVEVCGSCGILYDSVIPEFSLSQQGWFSQHAATHRSFNPSMAM